MNQPPLYPLRFVPIFRHYLWGGRRLASVLGKPLPPDENAAESWEIVDRGADQSLVAAGPLAGVALGQLVRERGPELLGCHSPQPRFPLLFKFLDAHQWLSLQVHPNDEQASRLDPPDLGKTEAWVILAAEPGSYLYAGLKRGFDRAALAREVARGTPHLYIERFEPAPGECYFLPAGTPHALGPGLLVAEIQQSSDVTYRLFDWNRLGPDGRPRALHVEAALDAIDYNRVVTNPQRAQKMSGTFSAGKRSPASLCVEKVPDTFCERLVECEAFVLDRWQLDEPRSLGGDERCHIVAVLSGAIDLVGDAARAPLKTGDVALLPAACGATVITPCEPSVLLDAYLPWK